MEAFYVVLGSAIIYATIHACVLSFKKDWKKRTSYEKFISIAGWVCVGLLFIGIMSQ